MGSVSPIMDEVITYIHQHKEIPKQVEGKTIRSTTIEGLKRRAFLNDAGALTEFGMARAKELTSLKENIDAPRSTTRFQINWGGNWRVTFDIGETNHLFWDKARRGDAQGLELAGLFLKPLASKKAAWVVGNKPKFKFENPDTETQVNKWFSDNHAKVVLTAEESANLGDMYIVVNPDLTISIVPPHVVKPIVDKSDFSKQTGWKIQQTYALPENPMITQVITDEFTDVQRVRTISQGGKVISTKIYRNPLRRAPVIHVPNNLRANEKFGHPEGEALLKALWQYNEIFIAAIEGNIKQGRPVPVFEKMGSANQVKAFMEYFAQAKTETQDDGSERTYYEIDFSEMIALGESGEFNFKSPASFTADTVNLLQLLFYLIVQHSELPEFIFGNAISSSKASAESQMEPFVKWVEKEQGRATYWVKELIEVYLGFVSLADTSVAASSEFSISWPSLTEGDGSLTLDATKWAYGAGLLTDEVAIQQLQRFLTIEYAAAMLATLKAEKEAARALDQQPFNPPMDTTPSDGANSSEGENPAPKESAIIRVAQQSLLEAQHTGVMIAFELGLDTATALASAARQSGIEPVAPEDMHVTLCFLGDANGWNHKRMELENNLAVFAQASCPIEGSIGGVGRFNASENSDGMDVVYASFDAPLLAEFRQGLVGMLEEMGMEISRAHGFTAHITLAYVEQGASVPNLVLATIPLCFKSITLYWGDERISYDLPKELEAVA